MTVERIIDISKSEKEKHFGKGEWVDEPDYVTFEHRGYTCHIIRVITPENEIHVFGGYLCGYIEISDSFPKLENEFWENINCRSEVTYTGIPYFVDKYCIGIDFSHSMDIVPSIEKFRNELPNKKKRTERSKKIQKMLDENKELKHFLIRTYKNIAYVTGELKILVNDVEEYRSKQK